MASFDPDPFALRVVGGVAAYLDSLDLLTWHGYDEDPAYDASTEWPTYIGPSLPPTPDAIVVISPTSQSKIRARYLQGFQIRLRGSASTQESEPDPREVASKGQAIADAFYPNGFPLVHVTLGDVRVGAILSGATQPFEPDPQGRHGLVMNFTARAQRPNGD